MKGFAKRLWYFAVLAVIFLILLPGRVYAGDVMVYDAAEFANLKNRTRQEVMEKYTEAQAYGKT